MGGIVKMEMKGVSGRWTEADRSNGQILQRRGQQGLLLL